MLVPMVTAQILQGFHHRSQAPAQAGAALISCWNGVMQRFFLEALRFRSSVVMHTPSP